MSRIRSKNTGPEKIVRSALHKSGYRFRLHREDLPGKPDIVLPKFRAVIFINGCFWHQHQGCKYAVMPKTNQEYWRNKLERNVIRDEANREALRAMGWRVLVIWGCEIKRPENLSKTLKAFLDCGHNYANS